MAYLTNKEINKVITDLKVSYSNMTAETEDQKIRKNGLIEACDEAHALIIASGTNNITAQRIVGLIDTELALKLSDQENKEYHANLYTVLNWVADKLNAYGRAKSERLDLYNASHYNR